MGAATVGGSAFPGEGPLPLGVDPPSLSVSTEKTTYERDEPITIALKNTGGYPARGRVNVTIHGPATALPSGSTHTAPEVAAASLSNILINPDATLTLDEMTIPLSAIPAGTPQFYVFVEWARGGRAVTNLFVDNTSSRPTPIPGILQRSFTAGPEYSWDGNRTITVPGAAGNHPFKIYFHFATSADVTAGHAPATLVPTTAYVDEIAAAFTTSWTKYKNDGFALPQIPIHAYVDNPGGEALGTFQPAAYGGHIIIGPKSLHDDKSADVRTTVAHELFHAFQTSYDYDEGLIIEGIATWIMDTPFGTKDYIGQSRAYINNPDAKPLRYQEHELVLFVRWLRDTHGFAKMKELTEKSADYDNEALLAHVFGKSFDELWVDFVKDLARRHVAGASAGVPGDAAELFDKPGVFGLKAWRWYWQDKTAVLSWDIANRTLDLPISNFNPEMVDEDVGQVKHAYGIDVFALTNDATDATDNLRVKFTSRDPGTTFTVILATKGEAATSWSLQTLTAGTFAPISDLTHNQALLFITRGEGGTGEYELEMRKP